MAKTTTHIELKNGRPVAVKKTTGPQPPPLPAKAEKTLDGAQKAALAFVTKHKPDIDALIIRTPEEYAAADALFGEVKKAQKHWTEVMEDIIRPIRQGLDRLYALNRSVKKPLEEFESQIEQRMKAYKLAEAREAQRLEDEKNAKLAKLTEKVESGRLTPTMQRRVEEQITEVEAETIETVVGDHSAAKILQVPVVSDVVAFCRGVAEGLIPVDCVEVRLPQVKRYYREDQDSVTGWPGVEIVDDVQISAR